ncbi:MAG: hypothetical protein AD742_17875 [Methylibium sp. NZG]|nr:MAG: hypothetical protein AD742_17875 [Methylibium sp. NZG]
MSTSTFVVDRKNLRRAEWLSAEREPLADGQARFRIDSFALTSNNITYAAFGESMNYWGFFPTGNGATGCIPVWGFADAVESRADGVAVGERFYGYWPMADEAVLQPTRTSDSGFVDGAEHRRELHAVYNRYVRCSTDAAYQPSREAEQALLRPLFITSFLIDDFLADNAFFGARTVVLSSASSKTAYGTAFCLARRRGSAAAVRIVGLTSNGNLGFSSRLGCYDEVLPYDAVATLPASAPTVYVDFSGDAAARAAVHTHFGAQLAYSCSVGGTHWDALGSGKGLPGPRPTLFFAPAQIKKRMADWGPAGLQQRTDDAWQAFMAPVTDAHNPWMRVVRGSGKAAVERVYLALLDGRVNPEEGHLLSA